MNGLSAFVMGQNSAFDLLDWLRDDLLPKIVERLNSSDFRRRLGLYGGEVIPTNERNLTDTRNRVSLIYEYLIADSITELLQSEDADEFCAYVVANRFPDLEIRNQDGDRGLRLEIKCLQSTAEEKAANFSTLMKDLHPLNDFLIVFLWEWSYDQAEIGWDRAPIIVEPFAFNALALAKLRDWYWLNRPSAQQGDAFQGYDLRVAITSNAGDYKEEEGNYGKLLRLWDSSFDIKPPMDKTLSRTEADYDHFRYVALHSGFENLSRVVMRALDGNDELSPLKLNDKLIGYHNGSHWFILSRQVSNSDLRDLMRASGITEAIKFSDKYRWTHVKLEGNKLKAQVDNRKPKFLQSYLEENPFNDLAEGLLPFGKE